MTEIDVTLISNKRLTKKQIHVNNFKKCIPFYRPIIIDNFLLYVKYDNKRSDVLVIMYIYLK